jgi:hypothetical protein
MNEPESEQRLRFAENLSGNDGLTVRFAGELLSEFAED